jgi:hypothetical protein
MRLAEPQPLVEAGYVVQSWCQRAARQTLIEQRREEARPCIPATKNSLDEIFAKFRFFMSL